jgi:acyl carrier protein
MDLSNSSTLQDVRSVVASVLGIEDRASTLEATTSLFGGLPELDSMAVVELVGALEERFGLEINDHEITGEAFETLGSLAAFVDGKLH